MPDAGSTRGLNAAPPEGARAASERLLPSLPQIAGFAGYAVVGAATFWGTASAEALFDALGHVVGVGAWPRFAVSVVALVGAVALLDVDAAGVAAVALSVAALIAIAVYVLVLRVDPAVPMALLVSTLVITWTRRDELRSLVARPSGSVRHDGAALAIEGPAE